MNKTELKNFAISSRLELLSRVRERAALFGITEEKCNTNSVVAAETFLKVDGNLLSNKETEQRKALEERIQNNGFVQVMEEAAYIWFNRFIALCYMEKHNLLPIDVRVIPERAGELPQIVREAQNVSIEGVDFSVVLQFLDDNKSDELYKYLIIALCNNLSAWLPQMFEKIDDYTELLFPDGLLKSDSFLGMLAGVEDENWQDIQVIGWLYQYYNTELKDETFALLKKNVKITKDRIGAATQLFTPEWIVRYMVENSLGRLWYEGHPNDSLKMRWRYYLDEAKQEPEVEAQLATIREDRKKLKPEEIKLLDPCMGSGHILVYAFDVLMEIYRSVGYTDRDAVKSIIENNLYGLDIDDRAAQLAFFALMMKAAEYDKRFLKRGIQPNVCAIQESNTLSEFTALRGQMSLDNMCINTANQLIESFVDAKEYGSILTPQVENLASVGLLMEQLKSAAVRDLEVSAWFEKAGKLLPLLAKQTIILQQKYDVVVTNPPYMGSDSMGEKLKRYVSTRYNIERYDLYAVFMSACKNHINRNGFVSMITQHTFLFALCFDGLRSSILEDRSIVNAVHLGPRAFEEISGEIVQTIAMIYRNRINNYVSTFVRLVNSTDKEKDFYSAKPYNVNCSYFTKLPNKVFAYSLSAQMKMLCLEKEKIGDFFASKAGVVTGNDDYFLRYWYEVGFDGLDLHTGSISSKYVPFSKGGSFVKWFGNIAYAIKLADLWDDVKTNKSVRRGDRSAYFQKCIGWSYMGGGNDKRFSILQDCVCGTGTPTILCKNDRLFYYVLGFLNTKIPKIFIDLFNPTLNTYAGDICNLPFVFSEGYSETIRNIVLECIAYAQLDWDSFESTWEFVRHPLVLSRIEHDTQMNTGIDITIKREFVSNIEIQYDNWKRECDERFTKVKGYEEELNRIFIDIYGLQEELSPEVADKDVTIRKADLGRDIRSLISYAVGCMFGRYSLDVPGLVYAGGDWDSSKYVTYPADRDGILPITDDEYFQDDIVSMFIRWVKVVYGEDTLEENLQFIANALNPSGGSAREVIRSYFMNDFYADHLKVYQKRPIYWQFDSGKQNGFKALIYLHRYDQDTVARLRTDYVHELQDRYRTQLDDAQKTAVSGDARQKAVANKRAQKLDKQLTELNKYEELVHHYADMRIPLDLDDGVKVNYAKLQEILTQIK